ncbi:unnamed protein product [Prunus brigantina]
MPQKGQPKPQGSRPKLPPSPSYGLAQLANKPRPSFFANLLSASTRPAHPHISNSSSSPSLKCLHAPGPPTTGARVSSSKLATPALAAAPTLAASLHYSCCSHDNHQTAPNNHANITKLVPLARPHNRKKSKKNKKSKLSYLGLHGNFSP